MRRFRLTTIALATACLAVLLWLAKAPDRQDVAAPGTDSTPDVSQAGAPVLKGRSKSEWAKQHAEPEAQSSFGVWALVEDGATGDPIEGAIVTARLSDESVARTSTVASGLARIEGLDAMPLQVTANAEGYAPDAPRQYETAFRTTARVHIRLWPVHEKPIQVIEQETQRPVADARLVLYRCLMVRMNRNPYRLEAPIEAGRTDARGRATLPLRATTQALRGLVLAVHAPGRRSTWWPLPDDAHESSTALVFRLPPGGRLMGTVRDGAGRPLGGVSITAFPGSVGRGVGMDTSQAWPTGAADIFSWRDSQQGPPRDTWLVPLTTTSDELGRYELPGIGLGAPYLVWATKPGFTPATIEGARASARLGLHEWDPVLRKAGRLVVRVVDPDGRPIPGVYGSASARSPRYLDLGGMRTDSRGLLVFENLGTGTYDVGLQPKAKPGTPTDQYGHAEYDHEKGWRLRVVRGETTEVELVLPHGAHGSPASDRPSWLTWEPVSGVVVDEDAAPLGDVVVRDRTGAPLAVTDANGEFSGSVIKGYGVTLGMNGPYASARVYEPPEDGSPLCIVARARVLVPVRIRIVLPEGAPPPDSVRLHLQPDWHGGFGFTQPLPSGPFQVSWPAPDAREALFAGQLQPGSTDVTVRAEGFVTLRREMAIDPKDGAASVAWTLDRGEVARGRVVDDRGLPVPGARVTVSCRSRDGKEVIKSIAATGVDGRFVVGGLAAGPWWYGVVAESHMPIVAPMSINNEDPVQEIDPSRIELRRGGLVRILVRDVEHVARAGVEVNLEAQRKPDTRDEHELGQQRADFAYGQTGLDGAATFLLLPGRWRIALPSGLSGVPDLVPAKEVKVTAGETQSVTFTLREP